jgi:putative radical SAM enzyme (TIGR03279 family)
LDCNIIKIKSIMPGSIADEAQIEQGDAIISINNKEIDDIFDYKFLSANENISLQIQKSNGEIWDIEIDKEEDEDLGIEFESPMIDEVHTCRNKCIFCFIDQLPEGLRDTLYLKDDDSRLSFLLGNYITLTNMSPKELKRIIKYRMSPVNISVHTTNPKLRVRMLNNRLAGDVLEKIKRLVSGRITVNCQIVLCR